jgi:hypothetical protein
MKKLNFPTVCCSIVAACAAFFLFFIFTGCKSALQTNGAVITTVDGAMTAWGQYTQTHQVPAGEILAVSNAYSAYYSAQMIASNTWVLAVSQTNYSLVQTITASVAANQTNLVNLINSFAK